MGATSTSWQSRQLELQENRAEPTGKSIALCFQNNSLQDPSRTIKVTKIRSSQDGREDGKQSVKK